MLVLVSCLRFLFFVFVFFFVFFFFDFILVLTTCFRVCSVCAIVKFCLTWTPPVRVSVCHFMHVYVSTRETVPFVVMFFFIYLFIFLFSEFVLACALLCTRHVFVVCLSCYRDRRALIECSSCDRCLLVLAVYSPWTRRVFGVFVVVSCSPCTCRAFVVCSPCTHNH